MINTKFEVYKLNREIKRSGRLYNFYRHAINNFNERIDDPISICVIKGIYHEEISNVQITPVDGGLARTKKIPMILCVFNEDVSNLEMEDFVEINNKTYKVSGVNDISNWGLIADISLEVVDDGRNPV